MKATFMGNAPLLLEIIELFPDASLCVVCVHGGLPTIRFIDHSGCTVKMKERWHKWAVLELVQHADLVPEIPPSRFMVHLVMLADNLVLKQYDPRGAIPTFELTYHRQARIFSIHFRI